MCRASSQPTLATSGLHPGPPPVLSPRPQISSNLETRLLSFLETNLLLSSASVEVCGLELLTRPDPECPLADV